jgi:hypothetical protein
MMPKVFYTEIDIENLVKSGVLSLEINDNVALTDLAYEKAHRLGLRLVRDKPDNPPSAPVRPYLAQPVGGPHNQPMQAAPAVSAPPPASDDLTQRIRSAVLSRMGGQVDPALLDVIIQRVLASTGVR